MKNNKIIYDLYEESIEESDNLQELLDYSDILIEIAKSLIEYRKKMGITQKELSKKIKIRQSMISKLESGEYNPTLKMLLKISYKLEKDSEFFLVIIENIRKKIESKKQYKELRKSVNYNNYKNVKILNKVVICSENKYTFIDIKNSLSIKNNYNENNNNYCYRISMMGGE